MTTCPETVQGKLVQSLYAWKYENGGLLGHITEVANQIIFSTDSQSSLAKD
jgi:hypothetical protein